MYLAIVGFSTDFSSCTTVYCSCMSGHFICAHTQWMSNVTNSLSFPHLQKIDRERDEQERLDPRFKGRLITVQELPGWLIKDEDEVLTLMCIVSTYKILLVYSRYFSAIKPLDSFVKKRFCIIML